MSEPMGEVTREVRELFRSDHPGRRLLASAQLGKATIEVHDFGADGIAVRVRTSRERAELARFRDRDEAGAVARLVLEALALSRAR
jgi:hypothetical protein